MSTSRRYFVILISDNFPKSNSADVIPTKPQLLLAENLFLGSEVLKPNHFPLYSNFNSAFSVMGLQARLNAKKDDFGNLLLDDLLKEQDKLAIGCIILSEDENKAFKKANNQKFYTPEAQRILSYIISYTKNGITYLLQPNLEEENNYYQGQKKFPWFPKSYYQLLANARKKNSDATIHERVAALFNDYDAKGSFKRSFLGFFNTLTHFHWRRHHTDAAKVIGEYLNKHQLSSVDTMLQYLLQQYYNENQKNPIDLRGSFKRRMDFAILQLTFGKYSTLESYAQEVYPKYWEELQKSYLSRYQPPLKK